LDVQELVTAAGRPGRQAHRGEVRDLGRIAHGLSMTDDRDRPGIVVIAEPVGLERHDRLMNGGRQKMACTDCGDNVTAVEDEPDWLDGRQCTPGVDDPAHGCRSQQAQTFGCRQRPRYGVGVHMASSMVRRPTLHRDLGPYR
jgi:hypothetical protein